jgi:glycosyltransferase involved in cell wall biosynthesis
MNPTVSVAIPVFNGERYLAAAVESVLGQTYGDLEVLISDNASNDATREIVGRYAKADRRVRYMRNDTNVGAAANFNKSFTLATGSLFQWLAHDDRLEPTFVERTVSELSAHHDAVLAFPWVSVVDEHENTIETWELDLPIDDDRPGRRFREILLGWHNSFYIFGLMRTAALRRTKLILPHAHGDTILLARLSLLGPFRQLDEHLFVSRRHPDQSNRMFVDPAARRRFDLAAYAAWFDPESKRQIGFPAWTVIRAYYRTLDGLNLDFGTRVECHRVLAHKALRFRHELATDVERWCRARWRNGRGPTAASEAMIIWART